MATGFNHPKVEVHIGDGFQFLDQYKSAFDVIITDSSDPEGPARAIFEKPYFRLLHNALRDGGVITTQGSENYWLHLPFIAKLKTYCKGIFPVAYKDASRDVTSPLRSWTPEEEDEKCRYHNSEIHKASFSLHNLAKKALR
ncbi:Spermine/spermidine synthase-domain-containing protein [Ilyonectria destructans]|nr:Spermine/spermidine synthase-domain-containing protein [Ilyonectria destructans]